MEGERKGRREGGRERKRRREVGIDINYNANKLFTWSHGSRVDQSICSIMS